MRDACHSVWSGWNVLACSCALDFGLMTFMRHVMLPIITGRPKVHQTATYVDTT